MAAKAWVEPDEDGWAPVRMLITRLRKLGYDATEHRVMGQPRVYLSSGY